MLCLAVKSDLSADFYKQTCLDRYKIVRKEVIDAVKNEMRMAALLLRLHFLDCFVNVSSEISDNFFFTGLYDFIRIIFSRNLTLIRAVMHPFYWMDVTVRNLPLQI